MTRLLLLLSLVLAACTPVQQATDQAGRSTAKTILPETLAIYFPQVPKQFFQPFTDCIVDNADASEVQSLAADAVTGTDQGTADTVRAILARSSTQQCLAAAVPGTAVPL
ncbi:hypothetical protein [Roseobacter ponti]|uniref:Lipoprotein n=1 Tax=Roseobacter ponti TaxID=1891787 RepID=A0A858SWM5_9RHOB|nr:hypothetical protein [Roseobacter ponti]QJF52437.1 hypothetical protein G3256_15300 [Roseobacter ponti]